MLLGLLGKDFSNVTACSVQTILSSIVETGNNYIIAKEYHLANDLNERTP